MRAPKTPPGVLPDTLRQLRKQRGLTQEEMPRAAADLGYRLSRAAVAKIELGKRTPTLHTAQILAAVLGVTVDALSRPIDEAA